MQKLTILTVLIAGCWFQSTCIAQRPQVFMSAAGANPLSNNVNMLYDRTVLNVSDESYLINGEEVLGFPFLYYGWNNGMITTMTGKSFSRFKLKYNIYNQTVFFSDGKDSLEASDPIKEFTLLVPEEQQTKSYTFVNANQFGRSDSDPLYYEMMGDGAGWELLKQNRKIVKAIHNGLPVKQGRKVFYIETAYFFYNKQTKKITPLKADGARLASALRLSDEEKKRLHPEGFDLSKESDILGFFRELSGDGSGK